MAVITRNSEARSTRLVPGGGLLAHEAAGGTTLARHVGLTPGQMRELLAAEPRLRRVSTFPSRALAEAAVAELLHVHAGRIGGWLNALQRFDLELVHEPKLPAGLVLTRGASGARPATAVRAVLRRDPQRRPAYLLVTAYPS